MYLKQTKIIKSLGNYCDYFMELSLRNRIGLGFISTGVILFFSGIMAVSYFFNESKDTFEVRIELALKPILNVGLISLTIALPLLISGLIIIFYPKKQNKKKV